MQAARSHLSSVMSADQPGAQTVLSPPEVRRQDSDASGCSSIADSPIYTKLRGKLISHEDMEFEKTKQLFFNAALRKCNPKAFAIVETIDDIRSTLKYCQDNNCQLCIVSGGHSDYGVRNHALVLNLSTMKKIEIDIKNQIAYVEPGVLLGELDTMTVKHNLATPLGTASYVGIGGQALDLGMGFLTPMFGFLINNVIEYELVKADGEIIKVNKKSHPELFWAMKGYGANFGVTINYTIKLHKIPPRMMGGRCYFAWQDATAVIKHLRQFRNVIQQRCFAANILLHIGKTSFQVFYRLLYVGDLNDGSTIMNMLMQSCPAVPLFKDIQPMPYDVFQRSCDFIYESGKHFYQSPGHFLEELPDDYVDTIVDSLSVLNVADNYCTVIYFSVLGGAIREIAEDESPFLFNKANWWVGAVGSSSEQSGYEKVFSVISGMFSKLEKYALAPDPATVAAYGRRLKALKTKYDPGNVFINNPCNIIPETGTTP